VRIIENSSNLGFAAANNKAFADARGDYVLLLNNDTIVLPNALGNCVHYMEQQPDVGVVGCRVEFPDRSFQTSCYRFTNLLELLFIRLLPLGSFFGERLDFSRYWARQFTEPTDVDVIAGCFMMVRKDVIRKIGGLDEDFFMYGEDEEWCSRIKKAGWKIQYYPGATIIHLHRFSSKKARRALRVIECMSPVLVLHKRRGPVVAWIANLIMLASAFVRLPVWIVLDIVSVAKRRAQSNLVRSRFVAVFAHLKGVFFPVWLPAGRNRG
jgi:hypothetical protein